jgi:hypothetical protein
MPFPSANVRLFNVYAFAPTPPSRNLNNLVASFPLIDRAAPPNPLIVSDSVTTSSLARVIEYDSSVGSESKKFPAKVISSGPGFAFAAFTASRKVQPEPLHDPSVASPTVSTWKFASSVRSSRRSACQPRRRWGRPGRQGPCVFPPNRSRIQSVLCMHSQFVYRRSGTAPHGTMHMFEGAAVKCKKCRPIGKKYWQETASRPGTFV